MTETCAAAHPCLHWVSCALPRGHAHAHREAERPVGLATPPWLVMWASDDQGVWIDMVRDG